MGDSCAKGGGAGPVRQEGGSAPKGHAAGPLVFWCSSFFHSFSTGRVDTSSSSHSSPLYCSPALSASTSDSRLLTQAPPLFSIPLAARRYSITQLASPSSASYSSPRHLLLHDGQQPGTPHPCQTARPRPPLRLSQPGGMLLLIHTLHHPLARRRQVPQQDSFLSSSN